MKDIYERFEVVNHYRKGWSKSKISDEMQISRTTVQKFIREYEKNQKALEQASDDVQAREAMEALIEPPSYDSSNRHRRKVDDNLRMIISDLLHFDEIKIDELGQIKKKQKRTGKQIFNIVRYEYGYDLSYSTVLRVIKEINEEKGKETFIKQRYDFGERIEFDFGEAKIILRGEKTKIFLAVIAAPASGFRMIYLYNHSKQSAVVDSLVRFFELVGGSYKEVVFDNMRNIVARFLYGNERELTKEAIQLSNYYDFEIKLTNPFRGNEKGTVEAGVHWGTNYLFADRYSFNSRQELYEYVEEMNNEYNKKSLIEEEKAYLGEYRPPYEAAQTREQRVDKYSFIRVDGNIYSVPETLTGKKVMVKIYVNDIEVYYRKEKVATWMRVPGKNKECVDIKHYLNTLLKKPGAVRNSVALKSVPVLKDIFDTYYTQNPRRFIELLIQNKDVCDYNQLAGLLDPTRTTIDMNPRKEEPEYYQLQIEDIMNGFIGGNNNGEND